MRDAIIFDVDGTLWDSRALVARAWNRGILAETGRVSHYTADDMTPLFGHTMDHIGELLFPDMAPAPRRALMLALMRWENQALETESGDFYPGVRETIPILAARCPLYIVSNCQSGYIEAVMHWGGFRQHIRDWLCFQDTGLGKGDNLRLLRERHNLRNPVYIGDTAGDWEACQSAGMDMIFAAYGLGKVEGLVTIHAFAELVRLAPWTSEE